MIMNISQRQRRFFVHVRLELPYSGSCMCMFLYVYVYTRVNQSMWGWSVKSWRPTLQCTSLQDTSLICQTSSETTACWLRKASYDFSAEPRSDKSSLPNKPVKLVNVNLVHPSHVLLSYSCPVHLSSAASLPGVCRPRLPLWGSGSHWGDSSGLRVPSATLWPTTLIRQQWLL